MFTQAQIEYIQKQYARGLNADAISNKLIEAGWEKDDIKDGLDEVARIAMQSSGPVVEQPQNTSPETNQNTEEKKEETTQTDNASPVPNNPPATFNYQAVVPEVVNQVKPAVVITSMPVPPVENSSNNKNQSKSIIKILILIIIILLIILGIAFAYYKFFYLPSTNGGIKLDSNTTSTEGVINIEVAPSDEIVSTSSEEVLVPSDEVQDENTPLTDLNTEEQSLDNNEVNSDLAPGEEIQMEIID